ncbi:MAG: rod shape-determining protein MreC [Solirubrobacteraceae bacterium]|nr:rod shape-determining protein MreC [Solirubrobacteraceae bacterium]
MYDKQVRRRRLALAGFVVASLLLLTVYFGESTGGGLHSVQRGALSVLGPIQEGAHRALKPFRDLFGWVGDTIDAKKERDQLAKENDALTKRITELQAEQGENDDLKRLLQINETGGLDAYDPIKTLVTARNANLFFSQVQIDKGSSAGVKVNDPVVNGRGLVGRVTTVTSGYSVVTLITDESFATGVKVLGANQQTTIRPNPNRPGELELQLIQNPDKISRGDSVVTAGSTSLRYQSFYPRNILVGTVSNIEVGEGNLDSRIRVKPAVDIGTLEWVEVLTKHDEPQTVAALP